jgi:hypothetical protein
LYQIRFQTVATAVFWVAKPNRRVVKDPQDERRDGLRSLCARFGLELLNPTPELEVIQRRDHSRVSENQTEQSRCGHEQVLDCIASQTIFIILRHSLHEFLPVLWCSTDSLIQSSFRINIARHRHSIRSVPSEALVRSTTVIIARNARISDERLRSTILKSGLLPVTVDHLRSDVTRVRAGQEDDAGSDLDRLLWRRFST